MTTQTKMINVVDIDFEKTAKKAGGMYLLTLKASALQRDLRRSRVAAGMQPIYNAGVISLSMIESGERY